MKRLVILIVFAGFSITATAFGAETSVEKGMKAALDTFTEGCQVELTTYCNNVTPGEGRILACLYAYEDKLSPRCEYALYDSVNQLNRMLTNLSYVVNECSDDLDAYCTNIKPGEGRLLDCLNRNEGKVSKRCNTALKDVGMK
jgi:hypothetical protein